MYSPQTDISLFAIIFGNLLSIILAFIYGWDLGEVMWIYWGQSVVIGVLNFVRMWNLQEFSTKGLSSNGSPVAPTHKAKRGMALFFLVHYGGFHLGYMVFLWVQMPLSEVAASNMTLMMVCIGAFVFSHLFSMLHNKQADFKHKKPNLGTLMFYPYMRIIPMHLTIIFGSMLPMVGMLLFMILKTFADAGMHIVEHRLFQAKDGGETIRKMDEKGV